MSDDVPASVQLLHRVALAGLPASERAELNARWHAHAADAASDGAGSARLLWQSLRAVASHTVHTAPTDPLMVPPILSAVSQCAGVIIIAALLTSSNYATTNEMALWVIGGCFAAVVALNAPLRRWLPLLATSHAIGVTGTIVAAWSVADEGVAGAIIAVGFVNFVLVTVFGIAEWFAVGAGQPAPPWLRSVLTVPLYLSANLVCFGVIVGTVRSGGLATSAAAALLAIFSVFGSGAVLRIRERHGTLFGPHPLD